MIDMCSAGVRKVGKKMGNMNLYTQCVDKIAKE